MTELKAGPELNALVAEEVMGWARLSMYIRDGNWVWSLCDPGIATFLMNGDKEYHPALDGELPVDDRWQHYAPRYSTRIDLSRQVEERMEELGLIDEYIQALTGVIGKDHGVEIQIFVSRIEVGHGDDTALNLWFMVHATPEQRCIAALMAKRRT